LCEVTRWGERAEIVPIVQLIIHSIDLNVSPSLVILVILVLDEFVRVAILRALRFTSVFRA